MKYRAQGFILAIFLFVSCGSVSYKYYGIQMPTQCYDQGVLLAPKQEDDEPMSLCKPEPGRAGKCVILESAEFFAAKKELLKLRQALKDCQSGDMPR